MKFVCNLPEGSGRAVGMCHWKDGLMVACENGIFYITEDGQLYIPQLVSKGKKHEHPFGRN